MPATCFQQVLTPLWKTSDALSSNWVYCHSKPVTESGQMARGLGSVLVVPNFFHFTMMEPSELLGTFKALATGFTPLPRHVRAILKHVQ